MTRLFPNPAEEDDPIEEFSSDSDDEFMYIGEEVGEGGAPLVKYTDVFECFMSNLHRYLHRIKAALYAHPNTQWWERRFPYMDRNACILALCLVSRGQEVLKQGNVCVNRRCQLVLRLISRRIGGLSEAFPSESVTIPGPAHLTPESSNWMNSAAAILFLIFSFFLHSTPRGTTFWRRVHTSLPFLSRFLETNGWPSLEEDTLLVAPMQRRHHLHYPLHLAGVVQG
jgi:hypothetical protein